MSRFLLSAASILVLVIASLFNPQSADARFRCEEREPLTLLSLYRTSDAIYVGRYDKDVDAEITEDTADYKVVQIKRHFSISSALKGESRKLLTISDTEYRYKNVDATPDAEVEHSDLEEGSSEIAKPGDSVMLFLSKDAETGDLNLTEMMDGIKKMTPEKLSAYEGRIKDLKGILSTEKPSYSELVSWMIRNAEDPLTRWEGTFELLQSFQNMDWQDERAKEAKEKGSEGEGESEGFEADGPGEFETGDPGYARSVTNEQKQALTKILLSRERSNNGENKEAPTEILAQGDRELIELVKRWGDSRVASSLLERLQQSQSDASASADLMDSIASMLRDDQLTSVSEEYSNIRWESEEDEIRSEVEPAVEPGAGSETAVQTFDESTLAKIEPEPEPENEPEIESEDTEGQPEAKKKTYGDLRAELLGKFVTRASFVIAKEHDKNTAKLNR